MKVFTDEGKKTQRAEFYPETDAERGVLQAIVDKTFPKVWWGDSDYVAPGRVMVVPVNY